MKNLPYYKINYIMPIYLEYAPKFMAEATDSTKSKKQGQAEEQQQESTEVDDSIVKEERTVFVKNLSFKSVEEQLEHVFKEANVGKIQSVKIVRRADN